MIPPLSFMSVNEALDHLSKVSGSLRKRWEWGRSLWLGYLFLGSLPMMSWLGPQEALIFQRRSLWNFVFFFSLSPCLFGCWLWKKASQPLAFTLPLMVFLHLAHNFPFVNRASSHYSNLSVRSWDTVISRITSRKSILCAVCFENYCHQRKTIHKSVHDYRSFCVSQWCGTSCQFHFKYWSKLALNWLVWDRQLEKFSIPCKGKVKSQWPPRRLFLHWQQEQLSCAGHAFAQRHRQLLFQWLLAACSFPSSTSCSDGSKSLSIWDSSFRETVI